MASDILQIQNLNAGYGKLAILRDISLNLPTHQFTAILGPNGSGKSTLLKSIFGLTTIFSGHILFEGHELIGVNTEAISQRGMAYVPQRNNIFTALTVQENLLLSVRHLDKIKMQQTLYDAYQLFPILTKRKSQHAGQLSGGERQMVAIALGWLLQPRAMLLDEPSAGLSPLMVNEVFRTLKHLCEQGITMIVVEQNARSILQWCDNVFVLREGQVVFQGTAAECQANEELVKSYLGVGLQKSTGSDV